MTGWRVRCVSALSGPGPAPAWPWGSACPDSGRGCWVSPWRPPAWTRNSQDRLQAGALCPLWASEQKQKKQRQNTKQNTEHRTQNTEQRHTTNTFSSTSDWEVGWQNCWSTHPVLVARLHPQPPGGSALLFIRVAARYQGGGGRHRRRGRRSWQGWRGRGRRGQLLELCRPLGVLLLLLLLHQLLGRLQVLQGDALGGPAGLPDSLGVGLPLDLVLLIPHRGDKRPAGTERNQI